MSIALQWGYGPTGPNDKNIPATQGFIYFDAVTILKKSWTGQVSKQPIDGGGLITDHFTRENPVITFSGIISGVDISAKNRNIVDANGNKPTNVRLPPAAVQINKTKNPVYNLLPDVVGQFFKPSSPSIVMASQSFETLKSIQINLESLFADGKVQLVTLYEYYGNDLKREPLDNLVMTSLSFTDSPDTGEALQCDITLEQVTFGQTRKARISEPIRSALVSQELANKASTVQDNGKQDSTVKNGSPKNTSKDSLLYRGVIDIGGLSGS
jgi:hypothetical protein